jgi:GTP-binding protein EngB required for normal cell division
VTGVKPHESPLMRLFHVASALGAAGVADESFELADRVADGRFFCAVLGQQKRGKSTFLNALLGEPVLPAGVAPITSAITVILHGKKRSARVRLVDGNVLPIAPAKLKEYATQAENPGNTRQVALIELFWPSPLLATGLCLVDTPGLGSIHTSSAEMTRQLVPQVDAAVMLLGADPPISDAELELAEQLARQDTQLLFALGKADRAALSDLSEAREVTARALGQRLGRAEVRLHEISATERLQGEPTRDWSPLEDELTALAQRSAQALVARAQVRGVKRLVQKLRGEVEARLADPKTRPAEAQRLRALLPELEQLLQTAVAPPPPEAAPATAAAAAPVPAPFTAELPSRRPPQAIPKGGMSSDLAVRVGPRKPGLSKMGVPALDIPVPKRK